MQFYDTDRETIEAMKRRAKTISIVEADKTYVGGKEGNKHESKKLKAGRGAVGKVAVLGMRERDGRVKAMPVGAPSGYNWADRCAG